MSRRPNLQAREHILQAARELLYESGYEGASMEEIAEAAGVKKANLFHYYPTKENLVLAAFEYASRFLKEKVLSQCCGAEKDPVRMVDRMFKEAAAGMQESGCCRGCFIGNLAQEISDHHEALRAKLADHLGFWTGELSAALERAKAAGTFVNDLEPAPAAEAIVSLYEGAMLFAKTKKSVGPLESARRMAVAYLEGYRA